MRRSQAGSALSPAGLSVEEAQARLAVHGPNALPEPPGRHPLMRFLVQFNSALIYFLLAGALAALLLGHHVDAGVIIAVVLINAIVGFVQEGKAEQALRAIRGMIAPHANVLRGSQRVSVHARDLVPGDIVLLEPGDRVPADTRLMRARGMLVDEAILTGEIRRISQARGAGAGRRRRSATAIPWPSPAPPSPPGRAPASSSPPARAPRSAASAS